MSTKTKFRTMFHKMVMRLRLVPYMPLVPLSAQERELVELMLRMVESPGPRPVVYGGRRSGKTTALCVLMRILYDRGSVVLIVRDKLAKTLTARLYHYMYPEMPIPRIVTEPGMAARGYRYVLVDDLDVFSPETENRLRSFMTLGTRNIS